MKRINGSVIGPDNPANLGQGIWDIKSVYQAQTNLSWPIGVIPIEYLVVAGGGSGGAISIGSAGGGGAGGYRTNVPGENSGGGATAEPLFSVSLRTPYLIKVGNGGYADFADANGLSGEDSYFATIQSIGGGGGGGSIRNGLTGGSGGGGAVTNPGGAGTVNQGFAGGSTRGGGGGASEVGGNASTRSGDGGDGVQGNIDGTLTYRAAGGGGGGALNAPNPAQGGGVGGLGSGGDGISGFPVFTYHTAGGANTGSGGGGGRGNAVSIDAGAIFPNSGGSGIVILRYPDVYTITNPDNELTFSTATLGSNKVTTFTAGIGYIVFS